MSQTPPDNNTTYSKPLPYCFAGDIAVQHMRYEEKSAFPVHRYAASLEIYQYTILKGYKLIKFLVSQAHEHDSLVHRSEEIAQANVSDKPAHKEIAERDKENSEHFKDAEFGWNNHDYYKFQTVSILKETELVDSFAVRRLKATRLHQTQTLMPEKKLIKPTLDAKIFPKNTLLVLSLDSKGFGINDKSDDLENSEFHVLEKSCNEGFGDIFVRLSIPRSAIYGPKTSKTFKNLVDSLSDFLRKQREKKSDSKIVLVISSEGLRNAGDDISYRVTWERSISDIVAIIRGKRTPTVLTPLLKCFSHIVVTFYNDAAVMIPQNPYEDLIVVASPSTIEGDHHQRFDGSMRGTETLVTASLAYEFGKQAEEFKYEWRQRFQMALMHGVKSSRYLQCRGYSSLHPGPYDVLAEGIIKDADPALIENPKYRAFHFIHKKYRNNNVDVLRYLWNRTRSIRFAMDGGILEEKDVLPANLKDGANTRETTNQKSTKICTWPMGDLTEIIAGGYPMFGGFPPVALDLAEGRELIETETRRVVDAWAECGWLEIGRVPSDKAFPDDAVTQHHPWWSLRSVAVEHLSKAINAGAPKLNPEDAKNIARFLLCELIVRFGFRSLNRLGDNSSKAIDLLVIERICNYSRGAFPTPKFYGKVFDQIENKAHFNFNTFLKAFTRDENLECAKFDVFEQHLRTNGKWLATPASGSILGIIPIFETGKLHTLDRRDTQSYRDLRERLLGFKASSEKKPLNLLVLGGPGSGKSFAVKEILKGVFNGAGDEEIAFLEYNVASFGGDRSVMTSAFLEIQDVALKGKLPIAFWDEYDTTIGETKLAWLASFLGPMQDGQFLIGQTSRALPKCVFVFAGSIFSRCDELRLVDALVDSPKSFALVSQYQLIRNESAETYITRDAPRSKERQYPEFQIEKLPVLTKEWKLAKGRDFKSRITGVLDIASVDRPVDAEMLFGQEEDDDSWLFRRACSLRNAFEMQAKHLLNRDKELQISNETLFSFLTTQKYSHGQRSIDSLVRMSSLHGRAIADGSVVPTASQVRLHAEKDFFHLAPVTYDKVRDWFTFVPEDHVS